PYLTLCTSPFHYPHPSTTEIYTLSLHDALPISQPVRPSEIADRLNRTLSQASRRMPRPVRRKTLVLVLALGAALALAAVASTRTDRKSTRLNSSHVAISYAVFCLKKKMFTTEAR